MDDFRYIPQANNSEPVMKKTPNGASAVIGASNKSNLHMTWLW